MIHKNGGCNSGEEFRFQTFGLSQVERGPTVLERRRTRGDPSRERVEFANQGGVTDDFVERRILATLQEAGGDFGGKAVIGVVNERRAARLAAAELASLSQVEQGAIQGGRAFVEAETSALGQERAIELGIRDHSVG